MCTPVEGGRGDVFPEPGMVGITINEQNIPLHVNGAITTGHPVPNSVYTSNVKTVNFYHWLRDVDAEEHTRFQVKIFSVFRFMVDVFVSTTQLERTVRDVRTFITTPPGGLEEKTQPTSAGVN